MHDVNMHHIDIRLYICSLFMFWFLELEHAIAYMVGDKYYMELSNYKCVGAKDTATE